MQERTQLGTGIGWRPEIADEVEALPGIDWVEAVAENLCPGHLPESLQRLLARGTTVVPHGVSLGLGDASRPDAGRLAALAERAEALGSPLVSEHIAFVRAGGMAAGHLLPVPRTRDALEVLCENVALAQEALPVPLAVENIAALVEWPDEELTEGEFLAELVERTGVQLLIDVANLHTNRINRGEDPCTALDRLPLDALAYVHVAGGVQRDGVWHDTHAHPVPPEVLDVLDALCARTAPPGVLLERDENFPSGDELAAELDAIRAVRARHAGRPSPVRTRPRAAGDTSAARERLATAQTELLAALVAGAPVPDGFDADRLAVQSAALLAKRRDIVAKLAPELPELLGDAPWRTAFAAYAATRPLVDSHRRDALAFTHWLLTDAGPHTPSHRRTRAALHLWHAERSGPAPLPDGLRRLPHRLRAWAAA